MRDFNTRVNNYNKDKERDIGWHGMGDLSDFHLDVPIMLTLGVTNLFVAELTFKLR